MLFGGGDGHRRPARRCRRSRCPDWVAGHPAARPGHAGVAARRAVRRAAARDDRDLRRRRQLAGQPQAAAAVGAAGASTRSAPRSWSRSTLLPAARRQRAPGPRRPALRGGARRPDRRGCAASLVPGARGRAGALARAGGRRWTPAATAAVRATSTGPQRRRTGALLLAGLLGICVGDLRPARPAPRRAAGAARCWSVGVAVAVAALASAGRRVQRSRYRPDPWRLAEFVRGRERSRRSRSAWSVVLTQVDPVALPGARRAVRHGAAARALAGRCSLALLAGARRRPPPVSAQQPEPRAEVAA